MPHFFSRDSLGPAKFMASDEPTLSSRRDAADRARGGSTSMHAGVLTTGFVIVFSRWVHKCIRYRWSRRRLQPSHFLVPKQAASQSCKPALCHEASQVLHKHKHTHRETHTHTNTHNIPVLENEETDVARCEPLRGHQGSGWAL